MHYNSFISSWITFLRLKNYILSFYIIGWNNDIDSNIIALDIVFDINIKPAEEYQISFMSVGLWSWGRFIYDEKPKALSKAAKFPFAIRGKIAILMNWAMND